MRLQSSYPILLLCLIAYACSPKPTVPQTVTVQVQSPNENVTIYIDTERAGRGKTIATPVLKNERPKQVRFERPGYKDAFDVIQLDKNDLRQNRPEKMLEIPQREEGQKNIQLTELAQKLDKPVERTTGAYDARKQELETSSLTPKLDLENQLKELEAYLPNTGYRTREGRLLQTPTNTLFVQATLNDLEIEVRYLVEGKSEPTQRYIQVEPTVQWKSYDAYGNLKHERSIKMTSGLFRCFNQLSGMDYERGFQEAMTDALTSSMIKYLASPQLKPFLKLEDIAAITYPQMKLLNTTNEVKDVEGAKKATVKLITESGQGFGFLISDDGWILTAKHLIDDTEDVEVVLHDNSLLSTKVVRTNNQLDLALLKAKSWDQPSFSIPEDTGFPIGLDVNSLDTKGRIQNIIPIENSDYQWLMTNLPLPEGHEGSPVFRNDGQLVGIVIQQLSTRNLGPAVFVLPIDEATRLLSVQQGE
ncbi:MAG: trypsin-like peptidase domain-containing protein [Bacteroidota bacterium]